MGELGTSARVIPVSDPSQTARTASRTITRVDLAEAVYRSVGLSRKESAALVQAVLDELEGALVKGESVKLSSFGRFVVRAKPERIGRNPKTGICVPITPRRVMSFKPSSVLRSRVNGEDGAHAPGQPNGN